MINQNSTDAKITAIIFRATATRRQNRYTP